MTSEVESPTRTREGLDPELEAIVERETRDSGGFVYCAACSSVIARSDDRIEVNGRHQHRCTNPYGFVFDLGCFAEALGCALSGERTAADTWFPGFQWRYASCDQCQRHLGWYFDSEGRYFYGLILDRIQSDAE